MVVTLNTDALNAEAKDRVKDMKQQLEEVEAFLAAIDANDDVQNMYVALAG